MQFELVGCTSAGKSTLAGRIAVAARAEGIELVMGDDFAVRQLGIRRLPAGPLRAVVVHVVAFWGCVSKGWQHSRFIKFAYRELHYSRIPRLKQWDQLRKVLKQLGRFEVIRCRQQNQSPVLVDEGTLHAAHNLFVHVDYEFNEAHLRQFAEQVPLPDIVIYLREREDVLVERTLHRGHPRITDPTRPLVAKFVHQAVLAFEQLSMHERIAPLTLIIQDGMIVAEPTELMEPPMRQVLEVLRGLLATESTPTSHSACEIAQAAHV